MPTRWRLRERWRHRVIVMMCREFGHDVYVCDEPTCYDYRHIVCRRCSEWVG